jgi:phytoene dehydrogenase-like protein
MPDQGPRDEKYDVVVVGAGLGGLSAGALLANEEKRVLICEQGDGAGGFAHAFKRGPYTFDSAVRVIAEGEMVEGVLRHLGVLDEVNLMVIDHLYAAEFPGKRVFVPAGLEAFMEAHIREFPQEEEGIRNFFGLRRQMFIETTQAPMQMGVKDLGNMADLLPTLFKYRMATLQDVLDEHLHDPKLKALCCSLWPYMGSPPSRLSFFAYSQFIGVLVDGPFYVQGSFQNLVDAFVTALERNDGELSLETDVEKILLEDGEAVGVRLAGGREIRAATVVSNADARHTFEDLIGLDALPSSYVKRLGRYKLSMSACVLYAVSNADLLALDPAHETFVYRHWDHEDTWRDIQEGKPGGMSLSIMTMLDPDLAPPNEHIVIVTAVAPWDIGKPWEEHKEQYMEELLASFEPALPGLRESITWMDSGTPVTLERYTRNQHGATYGWELLPRQVGSKRLAHSTPIPGLYLSGHWTEEGPASFRVILSGLNTANTILADEGIPDAIPAFKPEDITGLAQ